MAFGKYAVDFEQRVDYPRLRRERVAKVKAQMEPDGIGAIITWDPDNIRYIASYYVTTPMRASEMQAVFIARNGEPHLIGGGTPQRDRPADALAGRGAALLRHAPAVGPRLARRPRRGLGGRGRQAHGRLRGGEGDRWPSTGRRCRVSSSRRSRARASQTVHGRPVMDYARMIKTVDEVELIKIACANAETGARRRGRRHPSRGPGVRPGGHRHQGALRGRAPTTPRTWSA